jgi:hypothetical protein
MKDDRKRDSETGRPGDVLGISDVPSSAPARPARRRRAKGIDVRTPATGIGDVSHSPGQAGIDMGAGGDGTDISPDTRRRDDEG